MQRTMRHLWVSVLWLLLVACTSGKVPGAAGTAVPVLTSAPATTRATAGATVPLPPAETTPVPAPTVAPTAAPSATAVPRLRQLTTGGCCVQPFWSPDSREVRYIDRPAPDAPAGIYGASLAGGTVALVTERLGIYSTDGTLVAYPEGEETIIERVGGERWVSPSGGRPVTFSPDGTQIVWQVSGTSGPNERRATEVWASSVDGSNVRQVTRVIGGGFGGWFPDGRRVLVSDRDGPDQVHYDVLRLADGSRTRIAEAPRFRGATLSPDGDWLAYTITFSGDAARDGLWVVRTDGTDARRLAVYGAYRWRAEGLLLVMPLEIESEGQRLVEVDVATGQEQPLTDPAVTPLRIENGDWSLAPDGLHVAFVSSDDRNIWILDLPAGP